MACPICDQKPANCDCTETEKRQWSEIEDLRLTDDERDAVQGAIFFMESRGVWAWPDTLRKMLERLG